MQVCVHNAVRKILTECAVFKSDVQNLIIKQLITKQKNDKSLITEQILNFLLIFKDILDKNVQLKGNNLRDFKFVLNKLHTHPNYCIKFMVNSIKRKI